MAGVLAADSGWLARRKMTAGVHALTTGREKGSNGDHQIRRASDR